MVLLEDVVGEGQKMSVAAKVAEAEGDADFSTTDFRAAHRHSKGHAAAAAATDSPASRAPLRIPNDAVQPTARKFKAEDRKARFRCCGGDPLT